MKTKRGRIFVLVLALVLAIVLEVVTSNVLFKYNVVTTILSIIAYYVSFVFIIIDAYYSIKDENYYYKFSLIRDIIMLLALILLFYCFDNMQIIKSVIISVCITVLITFAYKLTQIANKYYPLDFDERSK